MLYYPPIPNRQRCWEKFRMFYCGWNCMNRRNKRMITVSNIKLADWWTNEYIAAICILSFFFILSILFPLCMSDSYIYSNSNLNSESNLNSSVSKNATTTTNINNTYNVSNIDDNNLFLFDYFKFGRYSLIFVGISLLYLRYFLVRTQTHINYYRQNSFMDPTDSDDIPWEWKVETRKYYDTLIPQLVTNAIHLQLQDSLDKNIILLTLDYLGNSHIFTSKYNIDILIH